MTDQFVKNIINLGLKNHLESLNNAAKSVFLDYLCVKLAGAQIMRSQCQTLDEELGNSMQCKALVNGIYAHVIELDDGHRVGMVHPGSPVISALLAVAEQYPVTQEDLLRGIIIGYEVTIRLACAVQPSHKLKFYHATGTCGTVGAAMGIAAMLGFDFEQTKSAFSAATTSAAGILEMIDGDTQMKPYNAGRAAMDGVTAAFIGKARFKSPVDALGGKRGFLKVMTDEPKLQYVTDFSGNKYMIESIYRKPYAACRHCHPSIEAALMLRDKKVFGLDEVKKIDVTTYKLAVEGHDHTMIEGSNSAKMSIPYSLAVALCTGKAGMDEFTDEHINDDFVLKMTEKVSVVANDELTALCPQKRVAIVTVKTDRGDFVERVDYPKGEPENPLTMAELETKFRSLAVFGGLTSQECDEVIAELHKSDFDLKKILSICNK
jgi:2-methylcitrate dehydratase PrpD